MGLDDEGDGGGDGDSAVVALHRVEEGRLDDLPKSCRFYPQAVAVQQRMLHQADQ